MFESFLGEVLATIVVKLFLSIRHGETNKELKGGHNGKRK